MSSATPSPAKKAPRQRTGVVLSNKMDKTIVVEVRRRHRHGKYHKFVGQRVRFKAHDADNACEIGDTVLLEETRPLSKDKRWRVAKIVTRASLDAGVPGEAAGG